MFEQLFKRPKALARQQTGPLVDERRAYLNHLAQLGMSRATIYRKIHEYGIVASGGLAALPSLLTHP